MQLSSITRRLIRFIVRTISGVVQPAKFRSRWTRTGGEIHSAHTLPIATPMGAVMRLARIFRLMLGIPHALRARQAHSAKSRNGDLLSAAAQRNNRADGDPSAQRPRRAA